LFYSYFLFSFLYITLHLIPTLTGFTLQPFPVLKSVALLPNYSFCPSHPLCPPAHTFPSHSPLTCHQTTLPSSIHSLFADQPPIPTFTQSLTQAPYTTTEIYPNTHKDHKTQQPPHCFPHSPIPLLASPSSAYPTSHISTASLTNVNSSTPTAYRYYIGDQGVSYIMYKLLVGYL
jgi:hypothetical protein